MDKNIQLNEREIAEIILALKNLVIVNTALVEKLESK